jgi:ParB family transcriptional regulator, chromosome partitioning protein
MDLRHIAIDKLCVSPANMRAKRKPDITNILPSVRARGVLVPLIVRPNPCPEPVEGGSAETFEIVAGARRYHAALTIAEEARARGEDEIEPLPCAVIGAGDDAGALEASLIENIARLDPDEVTRWETFTRLVREGRSVEEIALTFGLTQLQVKRTLALGDLLPRIRSLYRRGYLDVPTVRHLTLASKAQQKDWLSLFDDESVRAPTGQYLKAWLFGGQSIPVASALFDLASYTGEIVSDLFGEERWFGSADEFWTAQNAAIAEHVQAYRDAGWADVVQLEPGQGFYTYQYSRTPKSRGGKVFVTIDHRGAVAFHEGYLTSKEARAGEQRAELPKPARPELTNGIQNYVDLHRHAAVRAKLADQPGIALRLMVAHATAGSIWWRVSVEPQRPAIEAIAESVEACASEAAFDNKRRTVLALLNFDPEAPTVTGGYAAEGGLTRLFLRLGSLSDEEVLSVAAVVMGETLESGSPLIELLGVQLGVSMAEVWQADDALLDQLRDKEVLDAMLAEVAGQTVASANVGEPAKVKRTIIRNYLNGADGRPKAEGWVPRWMAFPPSAYTDRGGVGTVTRAAKIASLTSPQPSREEEGGAGTDEPVERPLAHAA